MKRLLTATVIGGLFIAGVALAHVPGRVNCGKLFTVAHTEATARDIYAGTGPVPLAKLQRLGHMELCQVHISDRTTVRSYDHNQAVLHSRRATTVHVAAPISTGGGYGNVPGVPYAFASCVAFRESTDGQGSSNIYGIIPASGYDVSGMSVAQQKQVFAELYAKDGTSPWAPYDGC